MPDDKHSCNAQETGICGLHNVTLERRDMDIKRLDKATEPIPRLMTLANRALGAFGLASLVISLLIMWIRDLKSEHEVDLKDQMILIQRVEKEYQTEMKQMSRDVQALTLQGAKNEGKYLLTLQQMSNLSKTMERILSGKGNEQKDY